MGRTCSICNHPEREKIEAAIASNEKYQNIAEQFHIVSISSITRHKQNCMPAAIQAVKLQQAAQTAQVVVEAEERKTQFVWNVLSEMEWLHRQVRLVYDEARADKDHNASLKALDVSLKQTKLFNEWIQGNEPGQAERLEQEWVNLREIIFEALVPYPEARLAVARALLELGRGDDHDAGQQLG